MSDRRVIFVYVDERYPVFDSYARDIGSCDRVIVGKQFVDRLKKAEKEYFEIQQILRKLIKYKS